MLYLYFDSNFQFAYTVIKFYIFKPTKLPQPEKENIRLSPVHMLHANGIKKHLWIVNIIQEDDGICVLDC